MAEAVLEQHPLLDYLREAGDRVDLYMPGGLDGFPSFLEGCDENGKSVSLLDILDGIVENLLALFTFQSSRREFTERFKYVIISSSLLSSSLPTTHPHSAHAVELSFSSTQCDPPGKWREYPQNEPEDSSVGAAPLASSWRVMVASLGATAFLNGYILAALIAFAIARYGTPSEIVEKAPKYSPWSLTLEHLDALITAGDAWDAAVNEAITIVEVDERNVFDSISTPHSPSSTLRVALQSTLHTTHSQSDNIRQLFLPLTSSVELGMLSEMYSPDKSTPLPHSLELQRPASLGNLRTHATPASPSPLEKRSTWSGAHTRQHSGRGRPLLTALLGDVPLDLSLQIPLPVTPQTPHSAGLSESSAEQGIAEERRGSGESFGSAALNVGRERRRHIQSLQMSQEEYSSGSYPASPLGSAHITRVTPMTSPLPPVPVTPNHTQTPSARSSRMSVLQSTRHPLSLSALRQALQTALNSKRYSASHLLALRFEDEEGEDEGYWEDVRSVMALLTSTLEDAAARLKEAMEDEDAEEMRRREGVLASPAPSSSLLGSYELGSGSPGSVSGGRARGGHGRRYGGGSGDSGSGSGSGSGGPVSFAPMPSPLMKFVAHMDSIQLALDAAKEQMLICVAGVQNAQANPDASAELLLAGGAVGVGDGEGSDLGMDEPLSGDAMAMLCYERLRRELGIALWECERGRAPLLEIVNNRENSGAYGDGEDVPSLGHDQDSSGGESDKADLGGLLFDEHGRLSHSRSHSRESSESAPVVYTASSEGHSLDRDTMGLDLGGGHGVDDASEHLLLTSTAQHLPMPGIEQVFESMAGEAVPFSRERSKLSREDRIKLAKAKREAATGSLPGSAERGAHSHSRRHSSGSSLGGYNEVWGPGGEVVQELKSVISLVNERKMMLAADPHRDHRAHPQRPHSSSAASPSLAVSPLSSPSPPRRYTTTPLSPPLQNLLLSPELSPGKTSDLPYLSS
ncbi:hypothetical protein BOTBODRAFT_28079 [Botryobasidium botryosum FD-172 SS1]|uniref:Uncharacterized protein n=1 Tax=Botryobasidium botryosum (strain FD-172 SS1) TaxID=930990 RepID=A0A067MXR8_BOTB1|nr:hypothetical protein BOTBODRAFT_28079 [Botryobasidium botryosum FD-172 SS1]